MNRLNFTTRYLFALTFVVALAVYLWPKPDPNATDPKWREMLPANSKPLLNIPAVSSASIKDGLIFVTATNNGNTTLEYRGSSPSSISLCEEIHESSAWKQYGWSGDGPCEEFYEISPGKSVTLEVEFFDDETPIRMLARFSEKGTDRTGMVVLANSASLIKSAE